MFWLLSDVYVTMWMWFPKYDRAEKAFYWFLFSSLMLKGESCQKNRGGREQKSPYPQKKIGLLGLLIIQIFDHLIVRVNLD